MLSVTARVGTFMQRTSLVQQMTTLQKQMHETQTQLVTEKKSQDYAGISKQSFRLVSIEAELSSVQRYRQTNVLAETRLNVMNTAVTGVEKALHDMRNQINALNVDSVTAPLSEEDRDNLDSVQEFAFGRLQDIAYLLNSKADGGSLFAGGRTDKTAVNFPFASLEEFQDFYNGTTIPYPDSRETNVANIKVTPDEYMPTPLVAGGGPPPYTLQETGGAFNNIPVGATIRLTDGAGLTDVYTVLGNNTGTGTLTLSDGQNGTDPALFVGGGTPADLDTVTVETVTYYGGDDLELEHRLNERRTIELGINAKDPAFEKAIRALGTLAQGDLENNLGRITDAMTLLNDAIEHDSGSPEMKSDIKEVGRRIGHMQVTVDTALEDSLSYEAFLEIRVADIENVNKTEAAVRLQNDAQALEIAYQSYARISSLSLQNYLRL